MLQSLSDPSVGQTQSSSSVQFLFGKQIWRHSESFQVKCIFVPCILHVFLLFPIQCISKFKSSTIYFLRQFKVLYSPSNILYCPLHLIPPEIGLRPPAAQESLILLLKSDLLLVVSFPTLHVLFSVQSSKFKQKGFSIILVRHQYRTTSSTSSLVIVVQDEPIAFLTRTIEAWRRNLESSNIKRPLSNFASGQYIWHRPTVISTKDSNAPPWRHYTLTLRARDFINQGKICHGSLLVKFQAKLPCP